MKTYVYLKSDPGLWTVGFYDPQGQWKPECDCDSQKEAAERVHYLNGGDKQNTALDALTGSVIPSGVPDDLRLEIARIIKDVLDCGFDASDERAFWFFDGLAQAIRALDEHWRTPK
jgi:hypothetical protein